MSDELLIRIGSIIAIVIFLFLIIKIGFNLKEFLRNSTKKALVFTGNTLLKIHNKNIQRASITSKKTFAKSNYYKKINTIIFDLGLGDVTVEGFIFGMVIVSTIVGCVMLALTRNLIFSIIMAVSTYVLLYTIAYMAASEGHFKREFAIMDATDLIIVNMKDGVLKAVKENIELFSPIVQEDFRIFVSDMYEYKIPIAEALDNLGERLGPSFNKFKEKTKEFEAKGRAGMLETFQDDMNENMYRRMDLRELMDTVREANIGFALALGVCGMLATVMIGSDEHIRYLIFQTTPGQIILVLNIIAVIGAFSYLQRLREEKRG